MRIWKREFQHWQNYRKIERNLFKVLRGQNIGGALIGPTNAANQATLWSRALTKSGLPSNSIRIAQDTSEDLYDADFAINASERKSEEFVIKLAQEILKGKSIYLNESLRPIFGFRRLAGYEFKNSVDDLKLARKLGKQVGVIFHGSDIRDTKAHALRNPFSPFKANEDKLEALNKSVANARDLLPKLRRNKIPLFVSTVDLISDVPDANWLPVIVDIDKFAPIDKQSPALNSSKVRVLYLPSKGWIKSADLIVPILERLHSQGVIEWRNWNESGPIKSDEVPGLMAKSDLVIDQFLGVIGVFPLEALAAGRAVMTYVPPELSENIFGYEVPPLINVNPNNLEDAIRNFAVNPKVPEGGLEYVQRWHDGQESIKTLRRVFNF